MPTVGLDHIAFPIADVERTIEFYRRLGFVIDDGAYREGRSKVFSVRVGSVNKINMHPPGLAERISLRGPTATPGCADVCFVWEGTFEECLKMLTDAGVPLAAPPRRPRPAPGRPRANPFPRYCVRIGGACRPQCGAAAGSGGAGWDGACAVPAAAPRSAGRRVFHRHDGHRSV